MSLINLQSAYSPSIVCQKIIGLWCYPHENLYKLLKFLVLLGLTVDSTALITYVIFNFGSKNVADTIYSLPASVEVILKSVLYRRNFHLVRACLDNLQKREFQPQNTAQLKILTDAVSLSQRVFYSFFGLCFLVFLMWVFVPLTKEEWALPTHYWVPFEYKRNGLYQMIYFLQCLAFVFHAMSNVSLDTFFAISMILIGAQCDVLGDTIRNMGRFDGSDGKKDLKECVHHYRLIKE